MEGCALYEILGVFCSTGCAVRWVLDHYTESSHQILYLFNRLLIEVFKCAPVNIFDLRPSPPPILLSKFGGPYSLAEFRAKGLVMKVDIIEPPFLSYSMLLSETSRLAHERPPRGEQEAAAGTYTPDDPQLQTRGTDALSGEKNAAYAGGRLPHEASIHAAEVGGGEQNHTGVCVGLTGVGMFQSFIDAKKADGRGPPVIEHTTHGVYLCNTGGTSHCDGSSRLHTFHDLDGSNDVYDCCSGRDLDSSRTTMPSRHSRRNTRGRVGLLPDPEIKVPSCSASKRSTLARFIKK